MKVAQCILIAVMAIIVNGCLSPSAPKASTSEYFQGAGAGFAIDLKAKTMSYGVSFSSRKTLPDGAMIVVLFENPKGSAPVGTDFVPSPNETVFNCKSPPLTGFKKGKIYEITIVLCDIADKTKIWSIHTEKVLCSIDPKTIGL